MHTHLRLKYVLLQYTFTIASHKKIRFDWIFIFLQDILLGSIVGTESTDHNSKLCVLLSWLRQGYNPLLLLLETNKFYFSNK